MRLGVHVPIARGLAAAAEQAARLGCETVQIFASNPNAWRFSELNPDDGAAFRRRLRDLDIRPLIVHTAYLLNLAAPDPQIYRRSTEALRRSVRRAWELGAEYVVTHIGSHKGEGYEAGIERICGALVESMGEIGQPCEDAPTVLLEGSAGGGGSIGWEFKHLADILTCLGDKAECIGFCLDTAHLYGAGHDVSSAGGLDDTLNDFDALVGLARLRLIHLNDTKVELGSKRDRHWHIGLGNIGLQGFRRIVKHPALSRLPGILETPMEDGWDERNMRTLRELRDG